MGGEIIISLIGMLISAGAFVNAFTFPGGTSDGVPGAGFFPQALCCVIFLLNLILIIKAVKARKTCSKEQLTEEQKQKLIKIAIIIISTIILIVLWGKVHFVILFSVYLSIFGATLRQNLKAFIPGAVISSVAVYVIFQQLLNVMLNS